jgi:phosphate-selective porin OprO and OprP
MESCCNDGSQVSCWRAPGLWLLVPLLACPPVALAQSTDTSAPPSAPGSASAADAADPDEPGFQWDFHWVDWQGLNFVVSQPTKIKAKVDAVPLLHLDELRLAGSFGGRLEFDGAVNATNGSLGGFNDGVELRRARITAKGTSIVGVPFSYRVDLGYVPGSFTVTQAYIQVAGIRYLGDLQFGQFTPPVGLQMITSSWDIGFMEPAAALQALAPGSQPGVQLKDSFLEERGTWTLGAYAGLRSSSEYGSVSKSFGNLMGRLTWLAVNDTDDEKPAANKYLHLGISGSYQSSPDGSIRYRSRPESYIAPFVIDTGSIAASSAKGIGLEALWVDGPFSAQAELIRSRVDGDNAGALAFLGGYAQVGWFLTGESRPYNRSDAAPGRITPRSNFGFGPDAGWGAVEVGARLSYTDLSTGPVQGGRLTMFMGTLNWILRPQLKCMFEVGAGHVGDTAADGNFLLAQVRMGLYFF